MLGLISIPRVALAGRVQESPWPEILARLLFLCRCLPTTVVHGLLFSTRIYFSSLHLRASARASSVTSITSLCLAIFSSETQLRVLCNPPLQSILPEQPRASFLCPKWPVLTVRAAAMTHVAVTPNIPQVPPKPSGHLTRPTHTARSREAGARDKPDKPSKRGMANKKDWTLLSSFL